MTAPLRELRTTADLEAALALSESQPVLIYKHSSKCGTSGVAAEEIQDVLADPAIAAAIFIVTVQTDRAISDAIEKELRVRHETPQALIVRDRRVVWNASHFRVTAEAIAKAVAASA